MSKPLCQTTIVLLLATLLFSLAGCRRPQSFQGTLPLLEPNTLDAARLGRRLYGLSAGAEAVLLVLNLDVFDRRGVALPAGGRWTRPEFEAILQRLSALFLTDASAQRDQARYSGVPPVRGSAGNPFDSKPVMSQAVEMVSETVPLPGDTARRQAIYRLQQRVQYALLGAMTPEQALAPSDQGAAGEGGTGHATP